MEPTTLAMAFLAASQAFNLPPGLLASVCYVETRHNVKAITINDGGSPSYGVCQIKLETARNLGYRGSERSLQTSQSTNTYFAAKYLRYQMDRYGGNVWRAISAYNAGRYIVGNKEYVEKVFETWTQRE